MRMLTVSFLVTIVIVSRAQSSDNGDNISIRQDPPGPVAENTRVVFSCRAPGVVLWLVGGVRATTIDAYTVANQSINGTTISNLTVARAKSNENNTEIICIVHGTNPALTYNETANLLIAAPPLAPFLRVAVFSNGSGLRANWDTPFFMPGYPVTSYTLTFVNKTDGASIKEILEQDLLPTTFDLVLSDVFTECHPLTYTILATNSVGNGPISNSVTIGFPIFPRTDNVVLHVDIDFSAEGMSILTTTFQVPIVCSYQEPASYTVDIIDDRGDLVNSTGRMLANSSDDCVTNTIYATLDRGRTYSAELIISHNQITGEAFATFLGIEYPSLGTETTTSRNAAVQCSGLIMLILITMTLNIIILLSQ